MQPLELQPAQVRALDRAVAAAAATWGDSELLRALQVRAAPGTPEPAPEPAQPVLSGDAAADDEVADEWDASEEEEAEQHVNGVDDWDASSSAEEDGATGESAAAPPAAAATVEPSLAAAALDSAAAFAEQRQRPKFIGMLEQRRALPAFAAAAELGALLDAHNVLLVSGATGCGKSTQIPQLVLERALCASPPQHCSVIVTQPRRLAAIGLAERVAAERAEECGAGTVGFAIRGDHRRCASTRILYCTVGVLLKRLEAREESEDGHRGLQSLAAVTHIVVDEVHERSVEVDLLLLYLRRAHALHARGDGPQPPKLVLMSATTETVKLAAYFSTEINATVPVGRLHIEGRTFPVKRHYLEDAVLKSGYRLDYDQVSAAGLSGNARRTVHRGRQQNYARQSVLEDDTRADEYDCSDCKIGAGAEGWMRDLGEKGMLHVLNDAAGEQCEHHTQETVQTLRSMDLAVVNIDLVVLLAAKLVEEIAKAANVNDVCASQDVRTASQDETALPSAGAVLIFLPGIKEIEDTLAAMSNHIVLGDPAACALFKLHSSVSMDQQSAVFGELVPSIVKLVVSTNIAETSITIPDVVAVIDAGLHKEMRHSASAGVRALMPARITLASAAQRAGRAGRVRPGVCYHLFMRAELNSMAKHQTPEVLTADLESLCLRLLANRQPVAAARDRSELSGSHNLEGTIQLLSDLIDAPRATDVKRAIRRLRVLGALNDECADKTVDGLSVLGRMLPRVPTDLWVGKLLLYGAALRILTPVCVIAASVSATLPLWPQREENRSRQSLDPSSDLMAALRVWQEWSALRHSDGVAGTQAEELCVQYGLSCAGLESLDSEAARLKGEVIAVLPRLTAARADDCANNTGLVRGAVVAALGANIAQAVTSDYSANPTRLAYRLSLDVTSGGEEEVGVEGRAAIHPSSGVYGTRMALVPPEKATIVPRPFVLYTSVIKTSQVFLSGISVISPLLAAVFCGDLAPVTKADSEALASGVSADKNRFSFAGLGGAKRLAVGGADEVTVTLNKSKMWHIKLRNAHAQIILKFRAAVRLVVETALGEQKSGSTVDCEAVVAALATAAEQLFAAAWHAPPGWVAQLDPTASTRDYCTGWQYTDPLADITRADKPTQPTASRAPAAAAAMARQSRVGSLNREPRDTNE